MITALRRIGDPPLVAVDEPAGSVIRLDAMGMKPGLLVASRRRQVNLRLPTPCSLLLAANFHPCRRGHARRRTV